MLKGESDEDGKGGRALAVQDVNAPAEYVWDRILDFGTYDKMVGVFLFFFLIKVFDSRVPGTNTRAEVYRKTDRCMVPVYFIYFIF